MRLPARIHDLKKFGHSITKTKRTSNGKTFAVYSLAD